MEPIDRDAARAALLAERARLLGGARRDDRRAGADDLRVAGRRGDARSSSSSATSRCATGRRRSSRSSTRRSPGSTTGTFGACVRCGEPIAAATARGAAVGGLLHRLPARRRPGRAVTDADRPRGRGRRRAARHASTTIRAAAERLRGVTDPDAARRRSDRRRTGGSSRPSRSSRSARSSSAARTRRSPSLTAGGAGARRHHLLVGQPRPGRRPRRAAAGHPGGHRHAVRRAGRSSASASRRTAPRSSSSGPRATSGEAWRRALAAERGLTVIPPFDDDRIIAGPGHDRPRARRGPAGPAVVLVPIGGGGLASGVATAVKALRPAARVIGVEPELAADARDSLRARRDRPLGRPTLVSRTIADGTRTQALGAPDVRAPAGATSTAIVTVSEAEIAAGVRLAAEREPARRRAVGRAVASRRWRSMPREAGLDGLDGPVVAVVSGGNVDPDRYREYLAAPDPRTAEADRGAVASLRSAISPALVGQALGQAPLADPDRGHLRRPPARSARGASRASDRIQPATTAGSRARKIRSPAIHMIPAASRWSSSGGRAPRPDERRVVRVEDVAGVEDDHRQERVLGHLHEQVARSAPGGASATAPGRARPPATRTAARSPRNSACSKSWTQRVLERRVEERREVGRPHDDREDRPTPRPGAPGRARPANGGPAGSSAGGSPVTTTPQEQRDRRRRAR